MEKPKKILVKDIIDSEYAVSTDRAEILFDFLKDILASGEKIELSFNGINIMLTVFAVDSIGRLYESFSPEYIENISMADADTAILNTIAKVKNIYKKR